MNESRREFLGGSLIAAGALGAGLVAGKMVRRLKPAETSPIVAPPQPPVPVSPPPSAAPATPVLTPTGEVIHVDASHARVPASAVPAHAVHAAHAVPAGNAEARAGIPGRKWVMVIDLAKCSGCGNCTVSCNKMHGTPADRQWIRVFRMHDSTTTAPYWFPKPCFHCDNPPCTKVCPVGATFKRQDGIVLIDNERCIGCRFCMAACPYSTRFFNWGRPDNQGVANAAYSPETGVPRRVGTVEKCDFCPEMARQGILPACVSSCDMAAIYYGDENEDAVSNSEETVRFSQLLEDRAGYRYLAELGTEPRVYYLPPKERAFPGPALRPKPKPGVEPPLHAHSSDKHSV
jgi:molybdopterin-containing oxidoreductase family iron-sulfur binding subunit